LAGRFHEIVVDEAQDCAPLELEVLARLRAAGIRVTMVCDMDQSIYAFRDDERTHLETFANTYAPENRLTLTGNFRSSPAICSFAASLRTSRVADTPSGPMRELSDPIDLSLQWSHRIAGY
jgi:superfamily I DNA/RNA helicase